MFSILLTLNIETLNEIREATTTTKKTYSKFFNNFQKHLASAITKLNVGAGWEQYAQSIGVPYA